MPHTLALPEIVEAPPADDPFRYGTRHSRRRKPDGSCETFLVPLTMWDVLHPQEGDHIAQSNRHNAEVNYLADAIRTRLAPDPASLVLSDCLVYWDAAGLSQHSPDVSVFFGVRDRDKYWPSYFVSVEGVVPSLLIEVVSPHARENDTVTKFIEYHKAGVPTYIIIDREKEDSWPTIRAYRAGPEGYEPLALDDRDCILLPSVGLRLCSNQNRIALYDAQTGEEVGDYAALTDALEAETAARKKAEEGRQKAEEGRKQAEAGRQKAEEAKRLADERAADLERQLRELREKMKGDQP